MLLAQVITPGLVAIRVKDTLHKYGLVSGHDFGRAVSAAKPTWALAPGWMLDSQQMLVQSILNGQAS